MKQRMKYSLIALSTVMALGFSACTEEAEYTPASPVASDCIKASFTTDNNALVFSPTDANAFSLPIVREATDSETTVLVKPTYVNNGEVFQIPESVTFAAGASTTTLDVTFEVPELEEEYTYSFELEEAAYDPYSENTVSTTTGTVLKQANWDQELGTGVITFGVLKYQGSCEVRGTSQAQNWYKAVDAIGAGNDIVFKVNEDNTVRVRRQELCGITVTVSGQQVPATCYVALNSAYTGRELGEGIYGNTYDPATGLIVAVLDYTCEYGSLGTGVEQFLVPLTE